MNTLASGQDDAFFHTLENISLYLDYQALERQVSVSTQKQILNALVFFARHQLLINDDDLPAYHEKARWGWVT